MDGCHQTAVMASSILLPTSTPEFLVNADVSLEDFFFNVKHTKVIDGNAVIRKRAVEIINEATANGLEKEEIQDHLCNAWTYIFNEECLGLDGNGLYCVWVTNKEEEDLDLTGGK